MENSSVASASSEAGSSRSQEIEELERFIDSYILEYQVQGILADKVEADGECAKTEPDVLKWTESCSEQLEQNWGSPRGKDCMKPNNHEEWDYSSNGSTGSRPSSDSRPGSGSRSGSRGRTNHHKNSRKNDNRDANFDMLGTDIWAANTTGSHGESGSKEPVGGPLPSQGQTVNRSLPSTDEVAVFGALERGAAWDLQPEKLDFTQIRQKHFRATPKPLPHFDREGMLKGKFEDDDGINLNDLDKFLPSGKVYQPFQNDAEISHTKKLFRRKRNDRRRAPRPPGGIKPLNSHQQQPPLMPPPPQQQHSQPAQPEHSQNNAKHNRDHSRQYQGPSSHPSGRQGASHHGYSQNRRWHQNQKHSLQGPTDKDTANRNTKETENLRTEEESGGGLLAKKEPELHNSQPEVSASSHPEGKRKDSLIDGPKVNLLQSSKERLRRRLKEKDEVLVETPNPQKSRMDKLIEILNSMRNNSSEVDAKLSTFMEEAQNSTNSEEMLSEIVRTIYQKAVSDRSFASTAAKLCDKMALFMVEGTKFRSLLLNMLQNDFTKRDELQQSDVEHWLGFITFLCEVFGTMRSSSGEPFRVLVCPIYACLRELLESTKVKEDAVLCCSMELQSTGKLLEEQLPEMMSELLAAARDKMLCPSESPLTRSLLMEVIELHARHWSPLEAFTTQYYNRTIQKLTA
ncbi:CBP80/20-dependent translation initiation factor isoform X2 [Erpetoichthys calabaricus]|uniref:CBP80/20-dependent translation initiation factor isoform X2 n=1 Tax=Erpetoichthys calabaricus TaxID=27687 RepID=UPI002234DB45|nr:CBP80/20-dependent translation initiation factor isoform X2 [Erpetoichthys calabaricus]